MQQCTRQLLYIIRVKEFLLRSFAFTVIFCGRMSADEQQIINTSDAQVLQQQFDDQFFDINEGFAKIRHILLHLMKTVGKFATYCEAKEHGKDADLSPLINELLPDLLIHALQIANAYDINLGDKYLERVRFLIERNVKQAQKKETGE